MHLSLSGYGKVDTTLGELSLHWRVDKPPQRLFSLYRAMPTLGF